MPGMVCLSVESKRLGTTLTLECCGQVVGAIEGAFGAAFKVLNDIKSAIGDAVSHLGSFLGFLSPIASVLDKIESVVSPLMWVSRPPCLAWLVLKQCPSFCNLESLTPLRCRSFGQPRACSIFLRSL